MGTSPRVRVGSVHLDLVVVAVGVIVVPVSVRDVFIVRCIRFREGEGISLKLKGTDYAGGDFGRY